MAPETDVSRAGLMLRKKVWAVGQAAGWRLAAGRFGKRLVASECVNEP